MFAGDDQRRVSLDNFSVKIIPVNKFVIILKRASKVSQTNNLPP